MTRRSIDWNKGLAQDLKDPNFARSFIESSIEEGLSIQAVLTKVIRAYGVQEFARKIDMPSSNILRAINSKHNPTVETLRRLLKPFALQLTVTSAQR